MTSFVHGDFKVWHLFTDQLEHVLSGVLDILCRSSAGLLHYLPGAAADLVAQALRIAELGSLELKTGALKTLAALVSSDPGTMFCCVVSFTSTDVRVLRFTDRSRNLKPNFSGRVRRHVGMYPHVRVGT